MLNWLLSFVEVQHLILFAFETLTRACELYGVNKFRVTFVIRLSILLNILFNAFHYHFIQELPYTVKRSHFKNKLVKLRFFITVYFYSMQLIIIYESVFLNNYQIFFRRSFFIFLLSWNKRNKSSRLQNKT